jgi:hypothetical protein
MKERCEKGNPVVRRVRKGGAVGNLDTRIKQAQAAGSVRLFSVRHEFPTEWAKFKSVKIGDATKTAGLTLDLRAEHYPFWSQGRLEAVKGLNLFAKTAKSSVKGTVNLDGATKEISWKKEPLGYLREGELKESDPPPSPTGDLSLNFDDNSMEDLWLAVAWGTGE